MLFEKLANHFVQDSFHTSSNNVYIMDVRAHAQAMEQVGAGILAVAAAEERKLDAQLKDMENLGKSWQEQFILSMIC